MTRSTIVVQNVNGNKFTLTKICETTGDGDAVRNHDRYLDEYGQEVPFDGSRFWIRGDTYVIVPGPRGE
ncbi:hypothetical protein PX52LOC_07519 [Limnoglobus roseus]|uniref:Uncharacterized protein n=1 Tax=Limnoglobus roseus TaxID=2598579 RepID=A0A5C1APB2_9BACT|nr:hypothetical protein PX52LOC_07519 [Limnoglobus roseus]